MNPFVKKNVSKKWVIGDITQLEDRPITSDVFYTGYIKWQLQLNQVTILKQKTTILSLIHCSDTVADPRWIIDIHMKMSILSKKVKNAKNLDGELTTCLYKGSESKGILFPKTAKLRKMGFVAKKSISVRVDFQFKYFHFSREIENYTDLKIRAKDTIFHVNKGILCSKSSTLYDLFVKTKSEEKIIDFCDVPLSSICYFLAFCYSNLDGLINVAETVQIASTYGCGSLLAKCEQYLISSPFPWSLEMKIQVAEEYHLDEVMTHSLNSIKTSEEVKNLRETPQFSKFNETTKCQILNRLLDLI